MVNCFNDFSRKILDLCINSISCSKFLVSWWWFALIPTCYLLSPAYEAVALRVNCQHLVVSSCSLVWVCSLRTTAGHGPRHRGCPRRRLWLWRPRQHAGWWLHHQSKHCEWSSGHRVRKINIFNIFLIPQSLSWCFKLLFSHRWCCTELFRRYVSGLAAQNPLTWRHSANQICASRLNSGRREKK